MLRLKVGNMPLVIQGYAIAKPMPAKVFEAWADNWKSPEEWKN